MQRVEIDIFSYILATAVYILLQTLWYSPLFMGKIWQKIVQKKQKNIGLKIVFSWINAAVLSFFFALFIEFLQINTAIDGFFVGFSIWLGFVATTQLFMVIWERRPFTLYLIDNTYFFIGFGVLGAILGS